MPHAKNLPLAAAVALAGASLSSISSAQWSEPFAGVRYTEYTTPVPQRVHAAEVQLCAPGVSVRATRASEGNRTPSSFGQLVGAELAVNGDFFKSGKPLGLAVGAGEQWAGSSDTTSHGFIAFGPQRVEAPPWGMKVDYDPSWMHEVVGGVPHVLLDGKVVDQVGSLCNDRHPRTAVGLSRDRRRMFVTVVDGRTSTSKGMTCAELAELMLDLGADTALNLDGGGSSAMWMRHAGVVNRPSDGSQRTVANHLSIQADGSGPAKHCAPPESCPMVSRVSGGTRYGTMAAVSKHLYDQADAVLIANVQKSFSPDPLAAGPLAAKMGVPLLGTAQAELPPETVKEIVRLGASKAIILGGEGAVDVWVGSALSELGLSVERIAGGTRYSTAAAIAKRVGSPSKIAVVTSGADQNLVDALTAAPLASYLKAPLLLAPPGGSPDDALSVIEALGIETVYVVGGAAAVSEATYKTLGGDKRIHGADRYATSVAVSDFARKKGMSMAEVWVARGDVMVDALAAAADVRPLLLTTRDRLPDPVWDFVGHHALGATIAGGKNAVDPWVASDLCRLISNTALPSSEAPPGEGERVDGLGPADGSKGRHASGCTVGLSGLPASGAPAAWWLIAALGLCRFWRRR